MNRERALHNTTSFAQGIVFASLLLGIVIRSGFPDVSTHVHVHSFHERRRGEHWFVFLKPDVPGKWLLSDELTKGKNSRIRFQVVLHARGSQENNRDFVSAPRRQGIALKTKTLL